MGTIKSRGFKVVVDAVNSICAKEQLAEAEGLVKSDPGSAISRARKILGAHPNSSRAASVMVRAYCAKGDLGNANGTFGRVKGSRLKAEVRKFCKREGLDLQN